MGVVVGLINGLLVAKLRLQPFMVTLCGLFIFRSLARWLTKDAKIEELATPLRDLSAIFRRRHPWRAGLLGHLARLVVVAVIFLHFSVIGRYFVALGSNEQAARYSGIPTDFYKILSYVICSFLTALYSFLAIMNSPSVAPSSAGEGYELIAIAGAVLGGCSLRGGEGTVYGIIVGTLIIRILNMMTTFWDIPSSVEGLMIGLILLIGIILDELLRRREVRR